MRVGRIEMGWYLPLSKRVRRRIDTASLEKNRRGVKECRARIMREIFEGKDVRPLVICLLSLLFGTTKARR